MNDLNRHPWMGIDRDEWQLLGCLFLCAILLIAILVVGGL